MPDEPMEQAKTTEGQRPEEGRKRLTTPMAQQDGYSAYLDECRSAAILHGLCPLDKDGNPARGINGTTVAQYFEDRYRLCYIDGDLSFLKAEEGSPFCDGTYVSGRDRFVKILKQYLPNQSKNAYDSAWQDVVDQMSDAEERGLSFTSRTDTFVDAAGQVIRIETMPSEGECVVRVVGTVSPDERVSDARRLRVVYDPSITECEKVDDWLMQAAQGDPWLAWLYVEACFSSCFCPSSEYKGIAVLYGPHGSDSKGVMSHVRDAIFSPGAFFKNKLHKLSGFRLAMMRGKVGFIDDDLQDGALPDDTCSVVKGLTGGDVIDAEVKHQAVPVLLRDPTFIVATNHPLRLPQLENASEAWERRLTVVPFYQVYKADPDATRGELPIVREFHRTITEDPAAMSYLLNLALEGVRMMVEDGGYVQTEESLRLKREWLGGTDTVSDFLFSVDLFGASWDCPHIIRIGERAADIALVFPTYLCGQEDEYKGIWRRGNLVYAFDESMGRYVSEAQIEEMRVESRLVAHEIEAVMGRYKAWCLRNGVGYRSLQKNSFSRLMHANGYESEQRRLRLHGGARGNKSTVFFPAGDSYDAFLESQTAPNLLEGVTEDNEFFTVSRFDQGRAVLVLRKEVASQIEGDQAA